MAKRNRKTKNRPVPVSAATVASRGQWEDIPTDSKLAGELTRFASEVQRAYAEAGQRAARMGGELSDHMNFSYAADLLRRTPELLPYVNAIAKEASSVPNTQKRNPVMEGSPTTQYQYMGGGWATNKQVTDSVVNARVLRDWADANEWVRAAINVRRQQIGRANIAVVPFNERKPYNKGLLKRIQTLLDQPNELRQNYYELVAGAMDDLLVLDRAVILKDMTVGRQPVNLYNVDGANIKIYPDWSGDPKEPRYLYVSESGSYKVPLRNDEAIVMMANPATYRYGLSPVQVLRNTVVADLAATKSAIQMVDMKPPPHMIQLEGATQAQLEQIRARYEADIAGKKEIFWLGGQGQAHVSSLVFSARDNQWLEWQVYLARKIAVVFQISPQQLGITYDINKATASSQQEIYEDTGLIPLLLLVEEYFNRELLADFATVGSDGRANFDALNLRILYPEVTEFDRQMHAERAIEIATSGLAGLPSMTLNQVLSLFGEEPVEGGNTFYVDNKTMGPLPWLSYDKKRDTGGYSPIMPQQPSQPPKKDEGPTAHVNEPGPNNIANSGPEGAPSVQEASKNFRNIGKRWTPSRVRYV